MTTTEIVIIVAFVLFIALLINQIRLLRSNLELCDENLKLLGLLINERADHTDSIRCREKCIEELTQQLEDLKK